MRRSSHAAVALTAAVVLAACSDAPRGPTAPAARPAAAAPAAAKVPAAERTTATVRWSALTRTLITGGSPLAAARIFAALSVAQYNAVIAAEDAKSGGLHPSEAAAVAGASATVLAALFPASALPAIHAQLAADEAYFGSFASGREAEREAEWEAGLAVGRTEGLRVAARALADGSAAVWTGTIPVGPGLWTFAGTPLSPLWGQVTPWVLESGDQFRPAAPPAFGSPEFQAAVAEVYGIWSARTPAQQAEAVFWQSGYGPGGPAWYLATTLTALAQRQHLDERKTARAFALMHMAIMDASIGCYDAKYTYWLLRPYNADPRISSSVGGAVAHPSYPSAHSCLTSAGATVLARLFPSAADAMADLIERAGLARIYSGLHYRFDVDAGRELGTAVGTLVLESAPTGHRPIPLD